MNTINEKLHQELLDITGKLSHICSENHIVYYLAWGSCLGAVRHHDIIPWDDDIDVYVHYKDLSKLKNFFEGDQQYFFQDLETDPDYISYWPKIRKNNTTSMDMTLKDLDMHWGICIDIFPLMRYRKPELTCIDTVKIKCLNILARLPYYKKLGNRLTHKVWSLLYRILGEKGRKKLFFKLLDSMDSPDGKYLLDFSDSDKTIILPAEYFGDGASASFGNISGKVPAEYDKYLTKCYGKNYMEIPPEDSPLRYFHSTSLIDCHKDYSVYKNA